MTLQFLASQINLTVTPSNPKTAPVFIPILFHLYPCTWTLLQLVSSDMCNYLLISFPIFPGTFIILRLQSISSCWNSSVSFQSLKVHTLHAWFTLDSSDSGHFARDELGEEREPLGEGYWKSIASRARKAANLMGDAWATYRMWKLQSYRKESIDQGNPNVYSLWQT